MRKSTNLSKKLTILFLLAIIGGFGTIKTIFVWKGERLENVAYKSINLIVQTLKKGSANKKTLVVIGNGWNVSVDANDRVTEHDPFFLIPNDEVQLLKGKGYEIVTAYFPFECEGLKPAGKELAHFINTHYQGYKVILLGHSKSGVCFANLSKWLKADGEDAKIITVSAPYGGVSSVEDNLQKLENPFQRWLYPKIIVPHQTNNDITEGSEFLEEMADYSGLTTRDFYCIRSLVPENSFNPITRFLIWVDTKLEISGDGIVGFAEQKPPVEQKQELIVRASHQGSMQEAIKLLIEEEIL